MLAVHKLGLITCAAVVVGLVELRCEERAVVGIALDMGNRTVVTTVNMSRSTINIVVMSGVEEDYSLLISANTSCKQNSLHATPVICFQVLKVPLNCPLICFQVLKIPTQVVGIFRGWYQN